MQRLNGRPIALSIAGYDPSAGAGVLADIKTFESNKVYGVAVITGNTHQNDMEFTGVTWLPLKDKVSNIALLANHYSIKAIKFGMHRNMDDVRRSLVTCKIHFPGAPIIWDPILSASAGFDLGFKIKREILLKILRAFSLITPNLEEACKLAAKDDAREAALFLSEHCPVLLKGGHAPNQDISVDYLFIKGKEIATYSAPRIEGPGKHGTGCVLSAAITASLAKGNSLKVAIRKGKKYVSGFIESNESLLGYHVR